MPIASMTTGINGPPDYAPGADTHDGRAVQTGFVPALQRLEVREISAGFLSLDERIEIELVRLRT
jgi:hypothetical protein